MNLNLLRTTLFVLLMATVGVSDDKPPHTYQKGTIAGWTNRRDDYTYGGHVKVYELKGADLIYQIGNCGAFQTGKFDTGQAVEYRTDSNRIYIRGKDGKEFKCKVEGTKAVENGKTNAP